MPSLSRWHAVTLPTTSGTLWTSTNPAFPGGLIGGYSARNTGVAAVTVDVYDNTAGSGTPLITLDLKAAGSAQSFDAQFFGGHGVYFTKGLWVVVAGTGTVLGSIFLS